MKIRNKGAGTILYISEIHSLKDGSYIVRTKDEEGRQLTLSLADLMKGFEPVASRKLEENS